MLVLHILVIIADTVFAGFQTGSERNCGHDVAITTPPNNDDCIHPVETSRLTLEDSVDADNKVYFSRPRVK